MKFNSRISITVLAVLTSVVYVHAQTASDARVADLVRAGHLRVALFPPEYRKDPATGELGGVQMDLARALAARLGVQVVPILYPTPADVLGGLKSGAWDIAFFVIDPVRAAVVNFSAPYAEREFTFLAPATSSVRGVADADRSGLRIAVVRSHASTLALTRIVKRAELVYADDLDAAFGMLRNSKADLLATARQDLGQYVLRLPGSRVLKESYGSSHAAIAVPKGHSEWLAYINEFIREAKVSGLVERALERAGQRGQE